jgi:hypothetical protein
MTFLAPSSYSSSALGFQSYLWIRCSSFLRREIGPMIAVRWFK